MKLQYQAIQDITLKDMFVDATKYGQSLMTDSVKIEKDYKAGDKDTLSYNQSIPSFCPAGDWNIYMTLRHSDETHSSQLKAHFVF